MAVTAPGTGETKPRKDVWFNSVNADLTDVDTRVDAAQATATDHINDAAGAHASSAISHGGGTVEDHIDDTTNPHGVTKAQVGLGNVDNTSDVDKPVSTAQAAALALKANANEAASVEDLVFNTFILGPITATESFPLFVARFPLQVVAVSLCNYSTTIVASLTDYWNFQMRRTAPNGTGVTNSIFVNKTTATVNMVGSQDFNFDSSTFDATFRQFAKGDVGAIVPTKIGSPAQLSKLMVTIGYRPL